MPFKCSNILSKIFYSSIGAEVLRIRQANINDTMILEYFKKSSKSLLHRMRRQGASDCRIGRTLRKMYDKHDDFKKFGENVEIFLSNVM